MINAMPLSLTDHELAIISEAADSIDVEKRSTFLERVAAMMKFRSRSDADLLDVVALAAVGLNQQT